MWCEKNNFKLKLPNAVKKVEEEASQAMLKQDRLDGHLREVPRKERVVPYTDAQFREAAIEWLVATDQVFYHTPYIKINILTSSGVLI